MSLYNHELSIVVSVIVGVSIVIVIDRASDYSFFEMETLSFAKRVLNVPHIRTLNVV